MTTKLIPLYRTQPTKPHNMYDLFCYNQWRTYHIYTFNIMQYEHNTE